MIHIYYTPHKNKNYTPIPMWNNSTSPFYIFYKFPQPPRPTDFSFSLLINDLRF